LTIPLVTIAVPSFNHGRFLGDALESIFAQIVPVEVFVADAGSTDQTLEIIRCFEARLAGWRSRPDQGQAAAINECIAQGNAPYVAWLNSDDLYTQGGLRLLLEAMQQNPDWVVAYGKVHNVDENLRRVRQVWTQPVSERMLAIRNVISQPGTLIARRAWDAVGGLDESLQLAMDYDLWWRLYKSGCTLGYVPSEVALNREHPGTKTNSRRREHYREAIAVVRRHFGRVPLKWWLAWPFAVWWRTWVQLRT